MMHISKTGAEEGPEREGHHAAPDPAQEAGWRRAARLAGVAGVGLLAVGIGFGAVGHLTQRSEAAATLTSERNAVPLVRTAVIKASDTPRQIDLPGSTQAFDAATVYARATGYISQRNVDIGSRVKAGDVLVVIAAPDLDQQYAQARAQLVQMHAALGQALANMELARVTSARSSRLVREGWTSQQQADTDRLNYAASVAAVGVARANLEAQQAQVNRLEQLTGFERVVAPFDGVITTRQIDIGSLVQADASSGTPLFSIAHTNVLRVQVYVPQDYFFGLKAGQQAEVTVPELPGRVFHGRLARSASALQPDSRTVLAEVDVDNSDGALASGLYTIVRFKEKRTYPVITIPSTAIVFDSAGLRAAVVQDGVVRMRHLDVAADNGATVDVRAGLAAGEHLILNPPIGVADGMRVATEYAGEPGAPAPGAKKLPD
jgi:RND family efflux transporter MFP subunit